MNLSFYIARRYIFSKKSHNAINLISYIAICGIAVACTAVICVLSVFNGFGELTDKMSGAFDPELKITIKRGKVFSPSGNVFDNILSFSEIAVCTQVLEENALFKFGDSQLPVIMKGVEANFNRLTKIDSLLIDGKFLLYEDYINYGTLGVGLTISLGARPGYAEPIEVYVPKRGVSVNMANPASALTRDFVKMGGVFATNNQKYDEEVAIVPIEFARNLYKYTDEVTALEILLKSGSSVDNVKGRIESVLGDDYIVEDRHQQQAEAYRMLQIEKWVTFLILSFIVILAIFNVIGPLSILILEKEKDIAVLRTMGADRRTIVRIFLYEGWAICMLGILVGLFLGLLLCYMQQIFGFISLGDSPDAFSINAYPVKVKLTDVVITLFVFSSMSLLSILYPVNTLRKKLSYQHRALISHED